jgi:hypothetical protein
VSERSLPELRASDAERESVAGRLREHAVSGRLTPEELDERLGAAYAARTIGELDALLADLLSPPPVPAAVTRRDVARRRLAHKAGVLAITNLIVITIWLATGGATDHGGFWPIWVLIGTGAVLARRTWRVLGPGAELRYRAVPAPRRHRR